MYTKPINHIQVAWNIPAGEEQLILNKHHMWPVDIAAGLKQLHISSPFRKDGLSYMG